MKPKALERALMNFISNATRYADTIEIKTNVIDQQFVVIIADNGPGVPTNRYDDILKPFYREDTSRNRKTGGVGLGMTIANDIIISHAGTLELGQSNSLGGLEITVRLPI
jgi:two-component system osmolarity sensor histidine kinase EnvZ